MAEVNIDDIIGLLNRCGLPPQESVRIPGKEAIHHPIPGMLQPPLAAALTQYLGPGGLYSHQARSIKAAIAGADVCLATPTASGTVVSNTADA